MGTNLLEVIVLFDPTDRLDQCSNEVMHHVFISHTKGISITSLYLELFSYTVMMLYNYCYGYSLLSYMEYPVLLVQEYILIFLVLKYKRLLVQNTYAAVAGYFAVVLLFAYQILPTFLLTVLVVSYVISTKL